jgi:hypothetical protein
VRRRGRSEENHEILLVHVAVITKMTILVNVNDIWISLTEHEFFSLSWNIRASASVQHYEEEDTNMLKAIHPICQLIILFYYLLGEQYSRECKIPHHHKPILNLHSVVVPCCCPNGIFQHIMHGKLVYLQWHNDNDKGDHPSSTTFVKTSTYHNKHSTCHHQDSIPMSDSNNHVVLLSLIFCIMVNYTIP